MDSLIRYAAQAEVPLDRAIMEKFITYRAELLRWNRRVNLTRITEPEAVVVKHFIDSLTCLQVLSLKGGERVLDVGSGAGFPGLPLRILRDIRLVLLDSSRKRVGFLRHLCGKLGFDDVEVIHGRAEDWGRREGYREAFAVVTARAVAELKVLAELCLPFVAVGGIFLAQKGPDVSAEIETAAKAVGILGGELEKTEEVVLPGSAGERTLVLVRKRENTPPKYPRRAGLPGKRPLGKFS